MSTKLLARRFRRSAAPLVVGLAATLCAAPSPALAAGRAAAGFGASLAAFRSAHPLDAGKCADTTCYGPLVAALPATYQFSFLDLAKGRVVGWSEALRRGTPLLQAELAVAEMFPGDATMSEVTVIRRDQYGASCAVYDIHSNELVRRFGVRAFGHDGGNIGVELATLRPSGTTGYNPRSIDLAIVMPSYADRSNSC